MATSSPPLIFDRPLSRARLARAIARCAPDFLMQRAAEDLEDRLASIRREFPRALDLATPTEHFAKVLAAGGRPNTLRAVALMPAIETGAKIVVDEEALPFAPESFDLIVSGMALHWSTIFPEFSRRRGAASRPTGCFSPAWPAAQA